MAAGVQHQQPSVVISTAEMTSLANVVHEIAWNIHEAALEKRCKKRRREVLSFVMGAERSCLMSIMGPSLRARWIRWMWIRELDGMDGWMGGWRKGGGLRLAEGEFLVGTHTSSNMLPRQLIKSGTPSWSARQTPHSASGKKRASFLMMYSPSWCRPAKSKNQSRHETWSLTYSFVTTLKPHDYSAFYRGTKNG